MPAARWWAKAEPLPGSPGARVLNVGPPEWVAAATETAAAGGQLLALWATPGPPGVLRATVSAALLIDARLLVLRLLLADAAYSYRSLHELFPAAVRMQRAAADLAGVRSEAKDVRPWLRHQAWPADVYPLQLPPATGAVAAVPVDDYAFVRVDGVGVHEIAVGPVHAGIIEPGHFRFSVVGEKVLRLEERLGYVHKGIERRFTELPALEGHRLAARISGDSAVAYSWAYCQALEGLLGVTVTARAARLRAVFLELERVQNHLGDLGALGADAGFAFGLMQFSRLKEELLRALDACVGQRYLLDAIVPGGVAVDVAGEAAGTLVACLRETAAAARRLRATYDDHAGVRDRFSGAGEVLPELARRLGLTGLAGRASGVGQDLRIDNPWPPYDAFHPARCTRTEGDVAARVAVRFDELDESCRLIGALLDSLPDDGLRMSLPVPATAGFAVGLVEGWRGPVLIALETGATGAVLRCHPHDPSWQNWPVLEHAVIGNIVPDFPLINKSFNLSYSGHDL